MYKIIALIGEAGCGKDRILKEVLAAAPTTFNEIISCTTRPPREGEVDGKNYYFLSNGEFLDKIQEDSMLEYTVFNGWFYGTPLSSLKEGLNIGVFNPAGVKCLSLRQDINLTIFKIECSAAERLKRQLNREKNPNADEIVRRYIADQQDFKNLNLNYIILPNETLEDCGRAVEQILGKIV